MITVINMVNVDNPNGVNVTVRGLPFPPASKCAAMSGSSPGAGSRPAIANSS